MTISFRVLDAVDAMSIVPRLCARHREELLRTEPDLKTWALGRVTLPGPQWAMVIDGEVMAIGGVADEGEVGALWFAGAMGWEMHWRPIRKAFGVLRQSALFKSFRCRVYADNSKGLQLVERLGFRRGQPIGPLVPFEMVIR